MYNVEAGSDFGLSLAILSLLKIELIFLCNLGHFWPLFFDDFFKEPGQKNSGEVREREIKEIVRVFNSKIVENFCAITTKYSI